MKHIALDGPDNGNYLTPEQAEAEGYELIEWQDGEQAYLHTATDAPVDDMEVPDDVLAEIEKVYS